MPRRSKAAKEAAVSPCRPARWTVLAGLCLALAAGCQVPPIDNGNDNGNANDNANVNDNANTNDNVADTFHARVFREVFQREYQGTDDCLGCHANVGEDILATGHWNWAGVATNLAGRENETHGKVDLINNFCIAVPSNEGRCTQCHIGYGWKDESFDFNNPANIDCLVCHDTTGTYVKAPTTAGLPADDVDIHAVAVNVGAPTRATCGSCHFYAGGGDNVKHGDLAANLTSPARADDVHMGVDGGNFACQTCHTVEDHGIAGMPLHSVDEGTVACTDCHNASGLHGGNDMLNGHLDALACEACHIPAIARVTPTKVYWDWSTAGQDIDPIPTDEYGKPLYDKKKGSFEWAKNVRPVLRWFNGQWDRVIVTDARHYDELPAVLAAPAGDITDPNAKLYPFKKMRGKGPIDPVNRIVLAPHLFGLVAGENPYWSKFDWDTAIAEGAAYAGQNYSGAYTFGETVMYLSVHHEIAPADEALSCIDCHGGGIDFTELGYAGDPIEGFARD